MWEPPSFGRFQGLWEEWDGFIVPRFPSDRHFHRGARACFLDEVRSVDRSWVLLVAGLFAIGLDLRFELHILLCLDDGQRMA